jgi:phospholipid/cholesterol/gamma-HCH transport system permease protein
VISAVASRLHGYATLTVFALTHLAGLRNPQLLLQLHKQVHAWGIAALPVALSLAALTGAVAVTEVGALLGQDNDAAQRLLFYGLFFELAPVLSALVVVARSSAAIASDLAVMHLHNEFTALRRMGVPAAEFLLLPRIWGLTFAVPVVTILFQGVCMGSGWLAVALIQNQSITHVAGRFLDFANPWLMLICIGKTTIIGSLIGAVACHHGCSATPSAQAISDAGIHAVGNGLIVVFMVEMVFAIVGFALK